MRRFKYCLNKKTLGAPHISHKLSEAMFFFGKNSVSLVEGVRNP